MVEIIIQTLIEISQRIKSQQGQNIFRVLVQKKFQLKLDASAALLQQVQSSTPHTPNHPTSNLRHHYSEMIC